MAKQTNWKRQANSRLLDHTAVADMLISTARSVTQGYDTNSVRASLAAYVLRLGTEDSGGTYRDMLEVAEDAKRRGFIGTRVYERLVDLVRRYA